MLYKKQDIQNIYIESLKGMSKERHDPAMLGTAVIILMLIYKKRSKKKSNKIRQISHQESKSFGTQHCCA